METMRKILSSAKGEGRFKTLLSLAVLAGFIYLGMKFVPPYIEYFKLSKFVEEFVYQYGDDGDEFIITNLPPKVQEIKSDLNADDIVIEHDGDTTIVSIDYSVVVVVIKDKYEKELFFHVEGRN